MANNQHVNKVQFVRNGTPETLIDISDTTATAADVSQGAYFYLASGEKVVGTSTGGTMVIRDSQDSHGGTVREITAGTVVQGTKSITANGTYDVASYADAQVNVPSAEPSLQAKTATPTTAQQTITPDSGYDGLSSVTVNAVPTGEYDIDIVTQEFYDDGGVRKWRARADMDVWGGWLPSGSYYGPYMVRNAVPSNTTVAPSTSSQTVGGAKYMMEGPVTVAAMPSGTAGTPTATKGSVSNHSVSVTPKVTNTTGYITGGTKTGTAVTVSASELVSGTLSITSSGTKNVTNYASASVAAGGATASATKGSVSNHSVTVTPSVTRTAGYVTAGTSSGTAVSVSASELVSGTLEVTESGTYDVTNYASADVSVSGGATNFVQGTFTTSSTTGSAQTINIPYTGNGYPIIAHIEVTGGFKNSNNTAWYDAIRNRATGLWAMTKNDHNTGFKNYDLGTIATSTKNSTSDATQYTSNTTNSYYALSYGASSISPYETVTFTSKTQLSVFVSDAGTYGLMPGISYSYFIVYSE